MAMTIDVLRGLQVGFRLGQVEGYISVFDLSFDVFMGESERYLRLLCLSFHEWFKLATKSEATSLVAEKFANSLKWVRHEDFDLERLARAAGKSGQEPRSWMVEVDGDRFADAVMLGYLLAEGELGDVQRPTFSVWGSPSRSRVEELMAVLSLSSDDVFRPVLEPEVAGLRYSDDLRYPWLAAWVCIERALFKCDKSFDERSVEAG